MDLQRSRDAVTGLLQVTSLTKTFSVHGRRLGRNTIAAVERVSFDVAAGETFGLVGESGSGKSTTGRLIVRLLSADSGSVRFEGVEALALRGEALKRFRRSVQIVFQDPYSSLDPTWTVFRIVAEPLRAHRIATDWPMLRRRISRLLDVVGLPADVADSYARELSGGQRQRVAIARALALNPKLIVCDEPVSALDVSTQAQVVSLLADLQAEFGVAYLFIAHDLPLVRQISRRIAVMLSGRIVELGPADGVCHSPAHPYTDALISAVPLPDPNRKRQRAPQVSSGDTSSLQTVVTGCTYQDRCPAVMDVCRHVEPSLVSVAPGHQAACHLHTQGSSRTTNGSGALPTVLARSTATSTE